MSNEERVMELEGLIRYHSDLYYNQSKPEVSDAEFDAMVDELKALDPTNSVLQEAGALPSYGRKVKHGSLMGSLEKATENDQVVSWFNDNMSRSKYIGLSPKMDGLSLRVNYEKGRMVEAATRGDGEVGMDVTDNVRVMSSIPNMIEDFTGEVRGEVYMRKSVWERLNKELIKNGERPFANPRNAASGSLMAKDPQVTAERSLDFMAFNMIVDSMDFESVSARVGTMMDRLKGMEQVPVEKISLDDVKDKIREWEIERPKLDYCIDGMVLELGSIFDQDEAGWTGKRPKGKLAFKFPPEQKGTKAEKVEPQVGRTGRLTPVARIRPTYLDGSTISNVTLHNYGRVKELGIRIGCEVLIEKAGDIIPQVVSVLKVDDSMEPVEIPEICPSCNGPVEMDENGVNLWCHNSACPAKLERNVLHWLKRLDVLGIGPGIVKGLCEGGYVKDLADLYSLDHGDLKVVTGGERAAEKAMLAILEKNDIPLWQFLAGLGIEGLGRTTSKAVAKQFKSLEQVRLATVEQLKAIDGIGDTMAASIEEGLVQLAPTMDRLLRVIDVQEVGESGGPLAGKKFCMTGALPSGTKRNEMAKRIEAAGGEFKSSVGKGLDYLIQADVSSTSSKTKKAMSFGVEIIDEDMLLKMMER